MQKLKLITAFLLSILIVYIGAGVPIVHYCCTACELAGIEVLEDHACREIDKSVCCSSPAEHNCLADLSAAYTEEEECCSAFVLKVNLMNQTETVDFSIPSIQLFMQTLLVMLTEPLRGIENRELYVIPPPSNGSRHYLALYSTLLI